jgi:hypothetical protein
MSIKNIIIGQISNFIDELDSTFPNNTDFVIFREKYNMIKSINSQLIVDYFIQFIYPHKKRIMSQDDNFFLEGGGQDEIKDKNGLNMRDNLKDLWSSQMSDDNKVVVWKYFKTFILLIEKYIVENINK